MLVRELIAELETKNPDAIVLRATDGDVPAKSVCEIDEVPINGVDVPAVLLN